MTSHRSVLVLEDDATLRELVSSFLRDRGYRVEPARGASEALQAMARGEVGAAIVDGMLPGGLSGEEFIREVRRTWPQLPILFASGYWKDLRGQELLTRQLGVARILHKPYRLHELLVWVEQVLAAQAPPPDAVAPGAQALGDDVAASIAALGAEYGARLREKLAQVEAALARARRGEAGGAQEAYGVLHKLHGTAGSYGFLEVGAAAGRLEALLRPAQQEGAEVDWARVDEGLVALSVAVAVPNGRPQPVVQAARVGTVLVVDEDEAWLTEVKRMGRAHLVRVVTARGVDEALRAVRGQGLDGALLRVEGGARGGFEAAARLRAEDGLARLPLGFYSTEGTMKDRVGAVHAGGSVFLPVPFTALDFRAAVERLVAARRPERSRVLVVDDDPHAIDQLTQALSGELVEVLGLSDPYRLLEALSEHRPDVLLLDVEMPGPSGFDLCRIVRSTPEWQGMPVLFITVHAGLEFRVAAFEAGADDYLTKPVLREELRARVHSRLERARWQRERVERDALTGLLLRRPFLEVVKARLAEASRRGEPLALALLDVDHFKRVNDTHGHLAGDRVLARLGRLLLGRFRREDVRGRWGGEEFVLALAGETARSAKEVLARTAAELAQLSFEADGGEGFRVTFSAGVVEAPADGATMEELLKAADARLYRAKAAGRNRIET